MVSFLRNCPQCGSMIAKDGPCPDCHWTDKVQEDETLDYEIALEFSRREKIATRNYAIFMVLMLGTGLIGLLTAAAWLKLIFTGDIFALIWIVLFTILTGGLSVMLALSKKLFPTHLNCPTCGIPLEELPADASHCPSCNIQLRYDQSNPAYQATGC